ncbi:MAG: enoyl-CoA hydratase [Gammaproteobacteria bacterium]|nr:MAG: enoyl-CoA hydratase [Gammaproteobacteria bacterium]PCJ20885.1 MAG: enoyl-CoA hydratase [Gammaproteobacteria bacterium]
MSQTLEIDIQGHTAVITINNPPANTWNPENLAHLKRLVLELNDDDQNYSLVITGQGDKFFSAGADLNLFADGDKPNARNMATLFGEAFETLAQYEGVSIAAINGYAMGGGLEAALACDIRIAERQAKLALPEASVGLMPCAGGTQLLPWLVGEGWAKRMILCGERVDTETALRIGLVEELVEQGEGLGRALALASRVEKQSPCSVRACKTSIQAARGGSLSGSLVKERSAFVDLFDTQDQREGVTAFLEKRSPDWSNR